MRIAYVTSTFPPYYGGIGNVCFYNAVGTAQAGHTVHVFTASHTPASQSDDPPELVIHRLPALFRFGNTPFLPQLLRVDDFDLVHLHYPFISGGDMVYLRSRATHIPYVVTYHQDLILDGVLEYVARVHHMAIGKKILKQAARLLVTSLDYARASRIAPIVRALTHKVIEMPNGVDSDRFHLALSGDDTRRRHQLPADSQVVLFVGGLDRPHYFKGINVLLHGLAKLADSRIKLLVVGEGDLRRKYMALANGLGLREHVIWCGRVPDEDLPAYYAACDITVLPSITMGEAFGVVLLESMACGKPVIASNLPGVRTVVNDGIDGLLVEPGNPADLAEKIQMLLSEPARRREMGKRGRAKVEAKYSWSAIIPRLIQVYEEVVAEAASGR